MHGVLPVSHLGPRPVAKSPTQHDSHLETEHEGELYNFSSYKLQQYHVSLRQTAFVVTMILMSVQCAPAIALLPVAFRPFRHTSCTYFQLKYFKIFLVLHNSEYKAHDDETRVKCTPISDMYPNNTSVLAPEVTEGIIAIKIIHYDEIQHDFKMGWYICPCFRQFLHRTDQLMSLVTGHRPGCQMLKHKSLPITIHG